MTKNSHTAGGRATEAGMGFQAAVTTWFAAQMLADVPIGSAFGLPPNWKIAGLQCETGDAMDDVVVRLDGGGILFLQCKTRPSLSKSPESLLGGALEQLVDLYARHLADPLSMVDVRAVIGVAEDAPQSLNSLDSACRLFDAGGTWQSIMAHGTDGVRNTLTLFESHMRIAWPKYISIPITDHDLVCLARLLWIRRFPSDPSAPGWRNVANCLGRSLFGSDGAGEEPMKSLLGLCRKFIRTGAPIDRDGLVRALRSEGHIDVSAPGYDKDVATLAAYSRDERARLAKHMRLPIGGGIPIPRDCLSPLRAAVDSGSFLVTGEPGAGKTGVLLTLAEQLASAAGPVVFLSVERFSGFRYRDDFRKEIRLDHDPIDVLAAWPGGMPGVLIVDALDASRGGESEPVIAGFIQDAVEKLGARWSIVASIRSFDLRNGRRFREIMRGPPPNGEFVEPGMGGVRHFQVPRLSETEVKAAAASSVILKDLEASAPPTLRRLLRNVFNLSLAAELLAAGKDPQDIRTVATQWELISEYEDIRLPSHREVLGVKAAVSVMVQGRRLTVLKSAIESDAVDDVLQAGVLVSAGDKIAFAHHVLFDHVAARFYLKYNDMDALLQQVTQDPTIGLILGPALRFALEVAWQEDDAGRPKTWRFLSDLAKSPKPDPVVLSTALRIAAERVCDRADVTALCGMFLSEKDQDAIGRLAGQLARFLNLALQDQAECSASAAIAWSAVAHAAAGTNNPYSADAARVVLLTLNERANLQDVAVLSGFGDAARILLKAAWSLPRQNVPLNTSAIRFVARSFGTDPGAARELLDRILGDRFDEHAPQEAGWLAEGVKWIIPHDPVFVAKIYASLYGREITDQTKTYMGGSPSRIMPITSTRAQDYQSAIWRLNESLGDFLTSHPTAGTAAVIGAVAGMDSEKRQRHNTARPRSPAQMTIGTKHLSVLDDFLSLQDWRITNPNQKDPLSVFADFLRACSPEAFCEAVNMTIAVTANASVWARLLGAAAERPGVADDLLWPLASFPHFAKLQGLARDAIIFLAAVYPRRVEPERAAFEVAALAPDLFDEDSESKWWSSFLARLLSVLSAEHLATSGMVALRADLEAKGELRGNRPFISISSGWSNADDIVESLLRSDGVDLEQSPDKEIRAASRRIEDLLRPSAAGADWLKALWAGTQEVVGLLDKPDASNAHAQLIHSSWGAICNAVDRIAKSDIYLPDAEGMPSIDAVLDLLKRLEASPYPEHEEESSQGSNRLAWGNWDIRVYAASSLVGLAPKFGKGRPEIVDRMVNCLRDPIATVRLQVAQALHVLFKIDPQRMWELVDEVADRENHGGVLNFFIGGSVWALSPVAPQRCAMILDRVFEREWTAPPGERNWEREPGDDVPANLAAYLYVVSDQSLALDWMKRWSDDLRRGRAYFLPMFHWLRAIFFYPYADNPGADQIKMARRAREVLDLVVPKAAAIVEEAQLRLGGDPSAEVIAEWRPLYEAADQIIDGVCGQLYFGSGAFQSPGSGADNPAGLHTVESKREFLTGYGAILEIIALHAQSRTIYNLLETLAYLVDGDPPKVFDLVAKMLLGPAAADGYQFEYLGIDTLVRLVRLYLADHREVFGDSERRQTLLKVLELFSSAGWPKALELLFELPDLLR